MSFNIFFSMYFLLLPQPKGSDQHGGGSWRLHRSVYVPQHSHCRAESRQADVHAFLRLEEGIEDRNVLPEVATSRQRHPGQFSGAPEVKGVWGLGSGNDISSDHCLTEMMKWYPYNLWAPYVIPLVISHHYTVLFAQFTSDV